MIESPVTETDFARTAPRAAHADWFLRARAARGAGRLVFARTAPRAAQADWVLRAPRRARRGPRESVRAAVFGRNPFQLQDLSIDQRKASLCYLGLLADHRDCTDSICG